MDEQVLARWIKLVTDSNLTVSFCEELLGSILKTCIHVLWHRAAQDQTTLTFSDVPDSSKSLTVSWNPDGRCGLCASKGYSATPTLLVEKVVFQESARTTMQQH